jgi:hypothetical protein
MLTAVCEQSCSTKSCQHHQKNVPHDLYPAASSFVYLPAGYVDDRTLWRQPRDSMLTAGGL